MTDEVSNAETAPDGKADDASNAEAASDIKADDASNAEAAPDGKADDASNTEAASDDKADEDLISQREALTAFQGSADPFSLETAHSAVSQALEPPEGKPFGDDVFPLTDAL